MSRQPGYLKRGTPPFIVARFRDGKAQAVQSGLEEAEAKSLAKRWKARADTDRVKVSERGGS